MPNLDAQSGKVYGDRYRLVSLVGTGASARVYEAYDERLARPVALKTLHPGLLGDDRVRRRFAYEAKTIAKLSHQNLLAVFDWGDSDGQGFLVSELLHGGTLREIIDRAKDGSADFLSQSQVLWIGLQAARGLAYAHANGLVHRDIKPANLLFGHEERLRIADFGVARLLAEAAWTEPEGALIGTARYAAPEQATGQEVDGRADVYSLALSMIEAVTGTVPLVGDSPLATMVLRQDNDIEAPEEMGVLRSICEAAGFADPQARPTADEFAAALEALAKGLPRPAPLPLVIDVDPPMDLRDAQFVTTELHGVVGANTEVLEAVDPLDELGFASMDDAGAPGDKGVAEVTKRRRRWPFILLVLLVLSGVGGYFGYKFYDEEVRIPTHEVSNWVGDDITEIQNEIDVNQWRVSITRVREDGTVADEVVEQSPVPGTLLEEGQLVTLIVSDGPELRKTPLVVGLTVEEAESALEAVQLVLGEVDDSVHDEDVAAGVVLSASIEPSVSVETGTPVDVVVSAGPAPRTVPDVVDEPLEKATAALEELQLVVVLEEAYSETIEEGNIIEVRPEVGASVERASEVTLVVSKGLPYIEVPDVTGMDAAAAANKLEEAGFVVTDTNGPPNAPVLATDPPAGEFHRKGTSVVIFTRR